MKEFKKYYDYIDKLINYTTDFMVINDDDESYALLGRLVVDLSENAMTWCCLRFIYIIIIIF